MQSMTITSFLPCYTPHVPQHVDVLLFDLLNQIMITLRQLHGNRKASSPRHATSGTMPGVRTLEIRHISIKETRT